MNSLKKAYYSVEPGFTLIELLVVIVIVSIVSAVAVPTWMRFLARHRVIAGQHMVHQGIQQAQLKSQQESLSWQFSVRETDNAVEMTVHPATTSPHLSSWQTAGNNIVLDAETNLASASGISYVQFDSKGNVRYRLGRVTLSSNRFPDIKHCVIVSTLIGNTRSAKENSTQHDGKYCY